MNKIIQIILALNLLAQATYAQSDSNTTYRSHFVEWYIAGGGQFDQHDVNVSGVK